MKRVPNYKKIVIFIGIPLIIILILALYKGLPYLLAQTTPSPAVQQEVSNSSALETTIDESVNKEPVIVLKPGPYEIAIGDIITTDLFLEGVMYSSEDVKVKANIISGSVARVGEVHIALRAEAANGAYSVEEVVVKVTDAEAPVLSVKGGLVFEIGSHISVYDLIDDIKDNNGECDVISDLPENAGFILGERTVTVTVRDDSGNETSETCTYTVVDTVAPVLKVKSSVVKVKAGEKPTNSMLIDSASDNSGEVKLSQKVISGSLDKEGECKIEVTAKDAAGNSTKGTVTVYIKTPVYNELGWDVSGLENQPYMVGVNRTTNVVTVYSKDNDGNYTVPYVAFTCSVGKPGCETPPGTFTTTDKYPWRLMVDGTYAQYAIRINGSILFHSVPYYEESPDTLEWPEYNKLGSGASLGCIRMRVCDVLWLYNNCPSGFTTVIYDNSTDPIGVRGISRIDENDTYMRNWDPTDPNPNNPWLQQ